MKISHSLCWSQLYNASKEFSLLTALESDYLERVRVDTDDSVDPDWLDFRGVRSIGSLIMDNDASNIILDDVSVAGLAKNAEKWVKYCRNNIVLIQKCRFSIFWPTDWGTSRHQTWFNGGVLLYLIDGQVKVMLRAPYMGEQRDDVAIECKEKILSIFRAAMKVCGFSDEPHGHDFATLYDKVELNRVLDDTFNLVGILEGLSSIGISTVFFSSTVIFKDIKELCQLPPEVRARHGHIGRRMSSLDYIETVVTPVHKMLSSLDLITDFSLSAWVYAGEDPVRREIRAHAFFGEYLFHKKTPLLYDMKAQQVIRIESKKDLKRFAKAFTKNDRVFILRNENQFQVILPDSNPDLLKKYFNEGFHESLEFSTKVPCELEGFKDLVINQ